MDTAHFRRLYCCALVTALAASGCSGASHILPSSALSATTPLAPASSAAQRETGVLTGHLAAAGYAAVRFRIAVPGRAHSDEPHRAMPAYISASTSKVVASVRAAGQKKPTKQTFSCTAVCTGSIVAPIGPDLFSLQLEDSGGHVLSQGSATILVFKTKHNVFNFTFDGVPASVSLTPVPNELPVVPAANGYVLFNALDADGNVITPDGDYTDAKGHTLIFDVASNNASFHLGVTSVSGPGTLIPFSYDGTQHVGTITLTPSAHPGVSTTVTLNPATVQLVPGIATRIAPPLPLQVLSVTQLPQQPTYHDANAFFVLGNSGAQATALAFNVVTSVYGLALTQNNSGPFSNAPTDQGDGTGYSGYINDGNNTFSLETVNGTHYTINSPGSNPCNGYDTPIGFSPTAFYCATSGTPGYVYNSVTSTVVAIGEIRLERTINGVDYLVTVNEQSASPPGLQVYTAASYPSPIPGALCVGENVTAPLVGYFGNSDGTVSVIGGSAFATFSRPVQSVVGYGPTVFVYESNGVFGYWSLSGTFESQPLPIGNVVDVVTGVNGAPMLVESDGTLDVMAI
ncbi:MAG: hypothetical protein JO092_02600 [Candidatus Eremiobacteraeota bacterium]|nr:hypothetical protein [Candidatus Eremiobacteraeota bacterium]